MLRTLLMGAGCAAMLTGCFEMPKLPGAETDCADCGADAPGATVEPPTGEVGGTGTDNTDNGGTDTDGTDAPTQPEPEAPQGTPPTKHEAARFLVQASFGPNQADIAGVERDGFAAWIEAQAALPVRPITDRVKQTPDAKRHTLKDLFWAYAIDGEDQLRQRVAYALSQITVVGMRHSFFWDRPDTYAHYMDILQREALGNYQDLIHEVSLSPAMGEYLSSLGNRRADTEEGFAPDENYAREVMQLFTIGLEELRPDGTSTGREAYTIDDVKGLAAVFTGLSWRDANFRWPQVGDANATMPMVSYDAFHEPGPKTFLGATIDVGTNAEASVRAALDHLLSHDNLAPFVSKQLIQKLVTANPSPAYVARVGRAFEAGAFEHDGRRFGEGRRGDMTATVAAILLDQEARGAASAARPDHGAIREPVLRYAQFARAFRDAGGAPSYGAAASSGRLRNAEHSYSLAQGPYDPPSVFGFTRPDHKSPGTWTARQGLVSPNLSLAGGARTASYINFMSMAVMGTDALASYRPDYASLMPLTDDPQALVAALDDLLTYGSLGEASRARIVEAVSAVTIDDNDTEADRTNRMRLAVLMMVTTPEYGVLR